MQRFSSPVPGRVIVTISLKDPPSTALLGFRGRERRKVVRCADDSMAADVLQDPILVMDQEAYDAVKSNDHRRLARRLKDNSGVDVHALNGAGLSML